MSNWTPEQLEDVACDLCGSRETAREYRRSDAMRVVECAGCGLAFLNPRPKEEFLPRLYESDYFTGVAADAGIGGLRLNTGTGASDAEEEPNPRVMMVFAEKFGGVRDRAVLEIGCATGNMLARMKQLGANAKGIDLSSFAAGVARSRGLDVEVATIEDYAREHSACADIVVGLEVIEHVPSPIRFLRSVASVLRPGGLLALSTPNYACAKQHGVEWAGFRTSFEHLYFFSAESLARLALEAGFEMRHVESSTYFGGPKPRPGFVGHQLWRLRIISYLVKELGPVAALGAIDSIRHGDHLEQPLGHNLFAVYSKR
jgi:SAM-dependent methyltransferase